MRIIHFDEFDDRAWQDALGASGALRALVGQETAHGDLLPDLLADLFQLFLQPVPRWRRQTRPTLQEHLLRETSDTHEFRALRTMAEGDAVNATMATAIIGRQALGRLSGPIADRLADELRQQRALEAAAAEEAVLHELLAQAGGSGDGDAFARCNEALCQAKLAQTEAIGALEAMAAPEAFDEAVSRLRRDVRQAATEAMASIRHIRDAEDVFGPSPSGSIEDKLRLADRLARSAKLTELVAMAGRVRRIALQKRASVVRETREAIVGVTVGDDPARALPNELALLATPATRPLFFRKLVEGQLLQHEQQGEERLGGGPIVVCLDGSGSMAGSKEVWSKAVTLAYLAIAERECRDLLVCQFGDAGQQRVFEFLYRTAPRGVSRERVLDAVECFLDAGGTDLEGPLRWAASRIRPAEGAFFRADVVALTDAETSFSPAFLDWWRRERERLEFHTFGVLIGSPEAAAVLSQAIEHVTHLADVAADEHALTALFS